MPLKIRCACGNVMLVPEERIGDTGNCPVCNRSIKVELSQAEAQMLLDTPKTGTNPFETSKNPKKKTPFFLTRLLSWVIYLLFFALLGGVILLHYVSEKRIEKIKFTRPVWLIPVWEDTRILLIWIKTEQYLLYCKVIRRDIPKSAKKVENPDPKKVENPDPKKVENPDPKKVENPDPKKVEDSDPKKVEDSDPKKVEDSDPKKVEEEKR